MTNQVSVVVPTRGDRPELILRTLESILGNSRPPMEVVVVDQSADSESGRVVARLAAADPRVRLVRSAIVGVSHARNMGVAATSAPVIAFTDDDCEASVDWLHGLVEAFSRNVAVGMCVGSVIPGPCDPAFGFIFGYRPPKHRYLSGRLAKLRDSGISGNMAVSRAAFIEVGGFDEMLGYGSHFPSMEDQDLTYRMLSAGFSLVHVPEASVVHNGPHDWGSSGPFIRSTYVAIGAAYTKHVRFGDWVGVLLLLNEVRLAMANLGANLMRGRRPFGLGRLGSLLVGCYRSFELDLGARRGLFADDGSRGR